MPGDSKVNMSARKITEFMVKQLENSQSLKRSSSSLSPSEEEKGKKKLNTMETISDTDLPIENTQKSELSELKEVLLSEFKVFWESMDRQYSNLREEIMMQKQCVSDEIKKKEGILSQQKTEITTELTSKLEVNSSKLNQVLEENRILKQENVSLKDRLDKLESAQLNNNVIINRIPKQQWEPYHVTKQWVYDMIASSISTMNSPAA